MPALVDALHSVEGRRLQRVLFGDPCPPGSNPLCTREDNILFHPDMGFVAFLVCLGLSLCFLCYVRNTSFKSLP